MDSIAIPRRRVQQQKWILHGWYYGNWFKQQQNLASQNAGDPQDCGDPLMGPPVGSPESTRPGVEACR